MSFDVIRSQNKICQFDLRDEMNFPHELKEDYCDDIQFLVGIRLSLQLDLLKRKFLHVHNSFQKKKSLDAYPHKSNSRIKYQMHYKHSINHFRQEAKKISNIVFYDVT